MLNYTQACITTATYLVDTQSMLTICNDGTISSHHFEEGKQKGFLCFVLVCRKCRQVKQTLAIEPSILFMSVTLVHHEYAKVLLCEQLIS